MNTALTVEKETMIIVKHPNGFEGAIHNGSLAVYYNDEQVLHASHTEIETEMELYMLLEDLPSFMTNHNLPWE